MTLERIDLGEKLAAFDTHWDPHVVASYNGNDVMVVKFAGAFPFHAHAGTDDFFLILDGEVTMDHEAPDGTVTSVTLGPGQLCIVPKGERHRPRATTEAKVLRIEPAGEPNTGDADRPAAAKPRL